MSRFIITYCATSGLDTFKSTELVELDSMDSVYFYLNDKFDDGFYILNIFKC